MSTRYIDEIKHETVMRLLVLLSTFFMLSFSQISLSSLFSESKALPADQAIQVNTEVSGNNMLVHFELAKNIYLYQDKIKLNYADRSRYTNFHFSEQPEVIEDPSFGRVSVFYHQATLFIDRLNLTSTENSLTLTYQGCDEAIGLCYPPQKIILNISKTSEIITTSNTQPQPTDKETNLNSASGINAFLSHTNTWLVVLTFFAFGIGLTFTPCVLPMVPILSSIIAGQKNLSTKKGFSLSSSYVLGMAMTFAIAGVVVGSLGARFNLQIYMQQPWVLIVFSGLFVWLALSMFGLYEIKLPRFIQEPLNNLNQKQSGGNLISVFLMGGLSAVVVSPCVSAPLAGALIYISTTGDAALGGMALFSLGLGMGLPLMIIGTTGASLLPKAGAWMEQVKILFGVLLLAVALWVLDRILPTLISLLAWASLLGVYAAVLGAFEPAQTNLQRIKKGIALLIFSLAFILMLNALGQPNPASSERKNLQEPITSTTTKDHFFKTITTESDFQSAIRDSEKNEKLVFVDVYADWCIECKIMSKTLFSDPGVRQALNSFTRIKLDITEFTEFHKTYLESQGIFGPPALLFYGLDGNSIPEASILGEIDTAEFLNHLEQFDP